MQDERKPQHFLCFDRWTDPPSYQPFHCMDWRIIRWWELHLEKSRIGYFLRMIRIT